MFNYQRVSLIYNGNVGVFARYEKKQSSDAPKVSFPSVFGQTLNTLLKNYRCGNCSVKPDLFWEGTLSTSFVLRIFSPMDPALPSQKVFGSIGIIILLLFACVLEDMPERAPSFDGRNRALFSIINYKWFISNKSNGRDIRV